MLTLIYPTETWAHRLPANVKLAALPVVSIVLFASGSLPLAALLCAMTVLLLLSCGGRFAKSAARSARPILIFIAVMIAWLWFAGTPFEGLRIGLRMLTLVLLSLFLTMTTQFDAIMQVIRTLVRPFPFVDGARLAFAAILVVRMTHILAQKGQMLAMAWRARSHRRPGWQIFMPWIIVALDDAAHVSEALRARGGLPSDTSECKTKDEDRNGT
ncbi:hypothetical protein BFP70_19275 [Thioclava sp. SK-1]|nr:hypothetical protein BFP70_19275 [Thioclava sp. SK-1]